MADKPVEKQEPEPVAPQKPEKAEKPKGKGGKEPKEAKEKAQPAPVKRKDLPDNFKFIVRMVNTDINGEISVLLGLAKINGVGLRQAQTITKLTGINPNSLLGSLEDQQIAVLEEKVMSIVELVPGWMVNRQNDWESGDDMHLVGVDVETFRRDDINRMKMIRCYKGIRHERGQKVRGQRTKSNGRTGLQVGVIRQKLAPAQAGEKPAEKKAVEVAKPVAKPAAKPAEKKV